MSVVQAIITGVSSLLDYGYRPLGRAQPSAAALLFPTPQRPLTPSLLCLGFGSLIPRANLR